VRGLARQLDAVVEMNSQGGADCTLTFPPAKDEA
jgi:two-component sensor histidine kinase